MLNQVVGKLPSFCCTNKNKEFTIHQTRKKYLCIHVAYNVQYYYDSNKGGPVVFPTALITKHNMYMALYRNYWIFLITGDYWNSYTNSLENMLQILVSCILIWADRHIMLSYSQKFKTDIKVDLQGLIQSVLPSAKWTSVPTVCSFCHVPCMLLF